MDKPTTKWERRLTECLIEQYSMHPCLYQVGSTAYSKREKRQAALMSIVSVLAQFEPHVTVSEVKTKINGLRSQYLEAVTKVIVVLLQAVIKSW
jgi:hypothetical protein